MNRVEHPMRPIETISHVEVERLKGLLFDIDDTVLTRGLLTEEAYAALFLMRNAGMRLVAVTGRAARFGEILSSQWPVDAVLAENGAIAFVRDGRGVRTVDWIDPKERKERRDQLERLAVDISEHFSEVHLAGDESLRVTDLAFDVGERVRVDHTIVQRAREFAEKRGARTSVSSIHFHITFDAADKGSGSIRLLRELFGDDSTAARFQYAFIGDSENDAAAFAAFEHSIGVKNLAGRPTVLPRFITSQSFGAGFAEAAKLLVERRK